MESELRQQIQGGVPATHQQLRHPLRVPGRLGGRARDVTAVRVCEAALSSLTDDEVKDCLSAEAAVSVGMGSVKGGYSKCEEEKKRKVQGSFHETYQERHVEVEGGHSTTDVLFSGKDGKDFSAWMESLKASPGLVSYSLQPIHSLMEEDDPKQEALKRAVSEYILERALWRNCTQSCPPGTQRSAHDPCSCVCPGSAVTNGMCCLRERGLGKLMVIVQMASKQESNAYTPSATDSPGPSVRALDG
ncbi:perforin-1-like [Pelodiscus sinensis]|uniref:perforin-1-like n=1 Tax=Pelodiscus sinensis TaxID=13735 RepID=UPI003F6D494B